MVLAVLAPRREHCISSCRLFARSSPPTFALPHDVQLASLHFLAPDVKCKEEEKKKKKRSSGSLYIQCMLNSRQAYAPRPKDEVTLCDLWDDEKL